MQEDYKTISTIQWTSAYKALIRWKTELTDNDSNVIRTSLRRGTEDPRQMTLEQMKEGKEHAIARKRTYRCTHSEIRKDHLRQCILKAEHGKNTNKYCGIRKKMVREGNKKMWYCINQSQNNP